MSPPSLNVPKRRGSLKLNQMKKTPSDDILVRYETPHSAVRRVVAVVAIMK